MTRFNSITEAEVRDLASEQSFDRGYQYYRGNAVFDIVRRGNLMTAKVEGSGYEPYQIQVSVSDAGIATTVCSCPYDWGGICKHIVAVLLILVHGSDEIQEQAEMADLLAGLTAEQLRQILLGVAAKGLEFTSLIEQEVSWLREQPSAPSNQKSGGVAVDINAVRREINKDFRLAGKGDSFAHGYYDEYAGLEVYPDLILQPHLDKIEPVLAGGDVQTAVTLITAIIETYIEGLSGLDEWVYEYNEDVWGEADLLLGAALAEVLLSLDMKPKQQKEWLAQIADWEEELGDLGIAETAVKHNWTYPPLVAAMQGNITDKGAWEEEPPYFSDELSLARLRILARQGRTQEYINLAEAEGQTRLAINMLAQSGDIDKAVAEAKAYLVYPSEILSVVQVLADKGELTSALNVAEHGLNLVQDSGRVELAHWTRAQASGAGNHDLALKAATIAFTSSDTLADYTAVQELAGDLWQTMKPELLQALQQSQSNSHKIDIYLHEKMLAEAMQTMGPDSYASDNDLRRVIEATREKVPNWGILKCKRKAEAIMDAGQAKYYETAVTWLSTARDIYQQHQWQQDWELYLDNVLEKHSRKYKLVPMLRNIRN